MTVKAIYENGVFKPREPVNLEENGSRGADSGTGDNRC